MWIAVMTGSLLVFSVVLLNGETFCWAKHVFVHLHKGRTCRLMIASICLACRQIPPEWRETRTLAHAHSTPGTRNAFRNLAFSSCMRPLYQSTLIFIAYGADGGIKTSV